MTGLAQFYLPTKWLPIGIDDAPRYHVAVQRYRLSLTKKKHCEEALGTLNVLSYLCKNSQSPVDSLVVAVLSACTSTCAPFFVARVFVYPTSYTTHECHVSAHPRVLLLHFFCPDRQTSGRGREERNFEVPAMRITENQGRWTRWRGDGRFSLRCGIATRRR